LLNEMQGNQEKKSWVETNAMDSKEGKPWVHLKQPGLEPQDRGRKSTRDAHGREERPYPGTSEAPRSLASPSSTRSSGQV
jgi:hypothetical protein